MRRCGELLKQFNSPGARTDQPNEGALNRLPTQQEATAAAGISDHQRVTAVRVANVPSETFERAVESPALFSRYNQIADCILSVLSWRCRLFDFFDF